MEVVAHINNLFQNLTDEGALQKYWQDAICEGFLSGNKGNCLLYSEQDIFPSQLEQLGQPWILRQFSCTEGKGGSGVRRVPASCFLLEAKHKANIEEYV